VASKKKGIQLGKTKGGFASGIGKCGSKASSSKGICLGKTKGGFTGGLKEKPKKISGWAKVF
jgi:hypothetical protein